MTASKLHRLVDDAGFRVPANTTVFPTLCGRRTASDRITVWDKDVTCQTCKRLVKR